jgi:hypothetical protein
MERRNNNQNYSNQSKNNDYNQNNQRIPQNNNYYSGYNMGMVNQQSNSQNRNNNYNNKRQPQDISYQSNITRNTEAPNYRNQNNMNKNEVSRMTEYNKGKERPLWSYREIKYDEFKQPRNTENITTTLLPKKNNIVEKQEIPRKSNLEQLQENDKKYFNNVKYQKVKVTKKVKNDNIARKGPEDDFEQKYSIQN